jgi:hypothetical protein
MEVEWASSSIEIQHQPKGANIETKKKPSPRTYLENGNKCSPQTSEKTLVLFAHCDTKSLPLTHGELKLIVVFKLSVPLVTLHHPNLLPKGFGIV